MTAVRQRSRRTRLALMWLAIAAGPVTWAVRFTAGILLVPVACEAGTDLPLHAATVVAAATTVAAIVALRRARPDAPTGWLGETGEPGRFLVGFGMLLGAISLALILNEGLAVVFIDPCM